MCHNRMFSQTKHKHHEALEKLVMAHLVRHFPPFIGPKVSLLCPQQSAINF